MKVRGPIVLLLVVSALIVGGVIAFLKHRRDVPSTDASDRGDAQTQYRMDADTAALKREFEAAWMSHVVGYTNYTTAGMADDYSDMVAFIKQWMPRILRNQIYKEPDAKVREKMADWLVREKSIDGLYYGMLIPHGELMARWKAYDCIAHLPATIDGVNLQFKDGRATWMSREYEDCEMTAQILRNYVWTRCESEVYAFVLTDVSANMDDTSGAVQSCSLSDYWLVRYRDGQFVSSQKLPYNDVEWRPTMEGGAPYGRKYTLAFRDGKVVVEKCVTGEVILSVE